MLRASSRELLGGRLTAAEHMINEAFAIGRASGQPEAEDVWSTQVLHLRHQQGRLHEFAPAIDNLDLGRPHPMPRPVAAWALACLGRLDSAQPVLHDAIAHLDDFPEDEFTLPVLSYLAETAALVRDREAARHLLSRLEPIETQHGNAGVVIMPVTDHLIGLLTATIGDHARAATSLQNALDWHRRIGAPFYAACSESALTSLQR